MSNVFVIDINKHPLNPVHPGLARRLLSSGTSCSVQAVLLHHHSQERGCQSAGRATTLED